MIQFFPAHVLVGCCGGIGVFLLITALESSTGLHADATPWATWFEPDVARLWGCSAGCVALHRLLGWTRLGKNASFDPVFFCLIPVGFYLSLFALGEAGDLDAVAAAGDARDRPPPPVFSTP